MKKYITIAALLVAGTAFANATDYKIGSSTTGNWDQYNGNNSDTANITVTESTTITRMDGSAINKITNITLTLNDNVEFSVTGNAKLPFNNTNETYTTTINLGTNSLFHAGTLSLGTQNPGNGNVQYTEIIQNSYLNFNSGSSITAGTLQTVAAAGGTASITVDLIGDGFDFANMEFINDTYSLNLITVTTWKDITKNTFTLAAIEDLNVLGYTSAGVLEDASELESGQYGLVFSNSGVQFAVAKSSLIPEPSAFGLLAGIGALALVASRRRRK